jgi:hypothetical protein
MLAEIYDWFTEGSATIDLLEVKALLEVLAQADAVARIQITSRKKLLSVTPVKLRDVQMGKATKAIFS